MANIVEKDVIQGAAVVSTLADGVQITRMFIVENLGGNPDARLVNALRVNGVPRVGQTHPSIPFVRVENVSVAPVTDSDRKALVTVSYRSLKFGESPPDEEGETQIRLGASVQSAQTDKFVIGTTTENQIKLTYTYPDGKSCKGAEQTTTQTGIVEKQVPLTIAAFSRQEEENPLQASQRNVGRVNSSTFLGGKKRTWLCTNLSGNSNDGGVTYTVDYEFIFNSLTWDPFVSFIDPCTNLPPPDVNEGENKGVASKQFQIYQTADFNKLKLANNR